MKAGGLPDFSNAKAGIRTAVLRRRDAIPESAREQFSRVILARLMGMEEFCEATSVMGYCGFGSEIDTLPLLRRVLESGKQLFLPKVSKGALEVYRVQDLRELKAGVWGIQEPDSDRCELVPANELEFVLVPGVAFDRGGGRIGYGKGYYDRLLTLSGALKVGACFEVQVVDRVPMLEHDVWLDVLLTETGIMRGSRWHYLEGQG